MLTWNVKSSVYFDTINSIFNVSFIEWHRLYYAAKISLMNTFTDVQYYMKQNPSFPL
jgi:hypothetical protein